MWQSGGGKSIDGGVEATCWAILGAVPSMKMQHRLRGGEGGLRLDCLES